MRCRLRVLLMGVRSSGLRGALEGNGHLVRVCRDFSLALARPVGRDFDVVVCDVPPSALPSEARAHAGLIKGWFHRSDVLLVGLPDGPSDSSGSPIAHLKGLPLFFEPRDVLAWIQRVVSIADRAVRRME
ncbi:MAG: hypothetical protein AB1758_32650 [Candidatus Eremiobacterota bacterium]